ncbi:hemin uptake protein HemP [Thiocystis violascens]|uniref:Hemin uptake protein hemP n=1 Tax=Thiocystis violascens (strain ATCC 17096 / DSM 198 / 6111) TaxID=765911 RepID=I3Y694_THIV6|nr:hemin uptake protein HemP [Thiocystis violascens]AFL72512.1 Hemin uptake protein hemP [Thiocystis violascens DSM 198]
MSMHADNAAQGNGLLPETCPDRNNKTEPPPLSVYSAELLGSDPELTILHAGERYRLRRNRSGRLELIGPDTPPQDIPRLSQP